MTVTGDGPGTRPGARPGARPGGFADTGSIGWAGSGGGDGRPVGPVGEERATRQVPRRTTSKPAVTGHLRRSVTWAGLRPGDAVSVEGTGIRSATWSFVAHVTNQATGAEWVEVVGGGPGDRMVRSFGPERVFPVGAGRRTKAARLPSLADAPQLPFA